MHFSLLGQIKVVKSDSQDPYTTCNLLIYFYTYISLTSSCCTFTFAEGPHLHLHSCDLLGHRFHEEYLLKQPPLLLVLLFEVMSLPTGAVEEHLVPQLLMSEVPSVGFPHSCNGRPLSGMGPTRERWCCARGWLSRLDIQQHLSRGRPIPLRNLPLHKWGNPTQRTPLITLLVKVEVDD